MDEKIAEKVAPVLSFDEARARRELHQRLLESKLEAQHNSHGVEMVKHSMYHLVDAIQTAGLGGIHCVVWAAGRYYEVTAKQIARPEEFPPPGAV